MKNYTLKNENGTNWYSFLEPNDKGETMQIELNHCEAYGDRSLPYIWFKNGRTDRQINKYLHCRTCVESDKGCFEKYNPQIKLSDDGKRLENNFEWILEDTAENAKLLLDEIAKRFYA